LLARSLINNKSKILGVLVPDLRISFFSEAVRECMKNPALRDMNAYY